jgi:hypothetical protein
VKKRKFLLNFVYYRPVGHVVEALKYARGFYVSNKNTDISILLNKSSPYEIAESCTWIKKVYPVDLESIEREGDTSRSFLRVPKKWDYVVSDYRNKSVTAIKEKDTVARAQEFLYPRFTERIAKGHTHDKQPILPYELNAHLDIQVPKQALLFAKKYHHNGPAICILPGGSAGAKQSPSLKLWLEICQALEKKIPNVKIYFTGITKEKNGRTATDDFTMKDINALAGKLSNAQNCFDIGLWNQLTLIQRCDIFLSPHTGFAFLAPCVGTPWLALSGCPWSEYIFNDLPFYSVLPDCGHYPSQLKTQKGCGRLLRRGKKALCMRDEALRKKVSEIVHGAELLLDSHFTYKKAVLLHLKNLKKKHIHNPYFLDGLKGLKRHKK